MAPTAKVFGASHVVNCVVVLRVHFAMAPDSAPSFCAVLVQASGLAALMPCAILRATMM